MFGRRYNNAQHYAFVFARACNSFKKMVSYIKHWFENENLFMTIQLLKKHLLELIRIEEEIKGLQEVAKRQGIELPEEEVLVGEIIKQINK